MLRAFSYTFSSAAVLEKKSTFYQHQKHIWDVLLILSSSTYEAVESFPWFLACIHTPFYESKAMLPKHGKGFIFHKHWFIFFFLRDYFFSHFLKQRIQKGLILPTNQKRKPMRLNGSDPKPRMQRCKAGQELIHLQAPQALMTVRKMK